MILHARTDIRIGRNRGGSGTFYSIPSASSGKRAALALRPEIGLWGWRMATRATSPAEEVICHG